MAAKKQKQTQCFRCDGTGQICNICGESEMACDCDSTQVENYQKEHDMDQFDNCEYCKGTGK